MSGSGLHRPTLLRARAGLVLFGALIGAAMAGASAADPAGQETLPVEIFERARAYLASRAGEAYAAENYEFQPDHCSIRKREDNLSIDSDCDRAALDEAGTVESYSVRFRYRPWAQIDAPSPWIHVRVPVDPARPARGYIGTFDASGTIVEPRISRSDAEARMRAAVPESKRLLPIHLLVPGSSPHANPVWSGSFTIEEHARSWVSRTVTVDSVTGDVEVGSDSTGIACE